MPRMDVATIRAYLRRHDVAGRHLRVTLTTLVAAPPAMLSRFFAFALPDLHLWCCRKLQQRLSDGRAGSRPYEYKTTFAGENILAAILTLDGVYNGGWRKHHSAVSAAC